jgi:RNA polymerase sigma factor (sigma-70 family)
MITIARSIVRHTLNCMSRCPALMIRQELRLMMHTRAALRRALADLTEEQQMVLGLRFGSEMPIRDVAELMGKTEGSVKQLQARAIAALSRKLSGVAG